MGLPKLSSGPGDGGIEWEETPKYIERLEKKIDSLSKKVDILSGTVICNKHRKYQGKRPPMSKCAACLKIYKNKRP